MKNRLVLILFILVVIGATYRLWLPLPATCLLMKDNIRKADCIVLLRGDAYFRFKKAVELYDEGYSKRIVISILPEREEELREYYHFKNRVLGLKDIPPKEFTLKAFRYFGKNPKGILFTDKTVTSTYDEAVATRDYMLKEKLRSLILVTSTYHTRRALMIFRMVFRGTGIKIYNCTARNEAYRPDSWWRSEKDVKAVSLEYMSIPYNFFYHFLLGKKRTRFDSF